MKTELARNFSITLVGRSCEPVPLIHPIVCISVPCASEPKRSRRKGLKKPVQQKRQQSEEEWTAEPPRLVNGCPRKGAVLNQNFSSFKGNVRRIRSV
jgi:hypothetical protein